MESALTKSDRRAFLSGSAAAIGAVSIPLTALATTPRSAWDHAVHQLAIREREHNLACDALTPAEVAYFKVKPETACGSPMLRGDTEETYNARVVAERADYARRDLIARQQSGVDKAAHAQELACDASSSAADAVMLCPAPRSSGSRVQNWGGERSRHGHCRPWPGAGRPSPAGGCVMASLAIKSAFDPADWLARFRDVGGWWVINPDDQVSVGWRIAGFNDDQHDAARAMFANIEVEPQRRAAIRDHLVASIGRASYGKD